MKRNVNGQNRGWIVFLALAFQTLASAASAQALRQTSVIVQGADTDAVARVVESVGGQVTHRLGIIHAVGATLTADQLGRLKGNPAISNVYADSVARTSAVTPAPGTWTLRDQFGTVAYNNNNGTKSFTTGWTEVNDDAVPASGSVFISGALLQMKAPNKGVQRSMDLTGATSAVLTFSYKRTSFRNSNDFVLVQISADAGASWKDVGRLTGPASDTAFRPVAFDISGLISATSVLRFMTSSTMSAAQSLSVDDVQVQYVVGTLTRTIRDEFNTTAFGNNDGTQRWNYDWAEFGDDGQPYSGSSSVVSIGNNNRLRFGATGRSVVRGASIPSNATAVRLSVDYRRVDLESTDYVTVQVSSTGGLQWTEVGRLQGMAADAAFQSVTYDVTAHKSALFAVRLVSSFTANATDPASTVDVFAAKDAVYVDNVQVAFDGLVAGTRLPVDIGAHKVHDSTVTGYTITGLGGTTIAIIDSGYWKHPSVDTDVYGMQRVWAQYDAIRNSVDAQYTAITTDENGHGSHLASIIGNGAKDANGKYYGVAPNAPLVSVKAFDKTGSGKYSDIIRAIDWVVQNRYQFNIGVLNCSFGAPARSHYWADPLNQAIMRAWQAGIVVVASAGNTGPGPLSIGVPGNNPYVITVGAMSDNYTPLNPFDDFLAPFSSTGPTVEGFVKPEVVAPGGHMWGLMPLSARIIQDHPQFRNDGDYFMMSGTSQATAVVSGLVALMLDNSPYTSPNDVKCRLLKTSKPALNVSGNRAYSVFQQGAGLVDAPDAVMSLASGCANRGLDINADLAGTRHFGGPANRDANGNYYIRNASGNGYTWNGQYSSSTGYAWADAFNWTDGFAWGDGFGWTDTYAWSDGYGWTDGFVWGDSLSQPMSLNAWVPQQ